MTPRKIPRDSASEIGLVEMQTAQFEGLDLDCGTRLAPVTLAYETYGTLSPTKDNAVLILHAFSGDAHAAGYHKGEDRPGWWHDMIGPGRAFDTNKYFVICSNVIGGCKGSTGPSSINPATGRPYALDFPPITIADMVRAQKMLLDRLEIPTLLTVCGGSMGGMQALQWVRSYPDRVHSAIPIATAMTHSPQQIALNEVGRQTIMADANWKGGNYYDGEFPTKGLAVARMIGHITFMSDRSMAAKFGRRVKDGKQLFKFDPVFEVEGYLRYKGDTFVKRFDANSYLYITKAIDLFDLTEGRDPADIFKGVKSRFLVIAFRSDWLYPPYQSKEIVRACKSAGVSATFCEIDSDYGHDAFLLEFDQETHLIRHFLNRIYREVSGQ